MEVQEGDVVRPYNIPSYTYEVVETGVERDVGVSGDTDLTIRMPKGDTLLRRTDASNRYVVASADLLRPT